MSRSIEQELRQQTRETSLPIRIQEIAAEVRLMSQTPVASARLALVAAAGMLDWCAAATEIALVNSAKAEMEDKSQG